MIPLLAYAEGPDTSDSTLVIVVIALAIIAAASLLTVIPIVTARRRRLSSVEGIAAISIVWGLLTAGTAIYLVNANMKWTHEYDVQVHSGNPGRSAPPAQPWTLWIFLAGIYAGAIVWSSTAKPYTTPATKGFEVINPSPPEEPKD